MIDSENKKVERIDRKIQKIDKKINKKHSPLVYEIFEHYIDKKNKKLEQRKNDLKMQKSLVEDDILQNEL